MLEGTLGSRIFLAWAWFSAFVEAVNVRSRLYHLPSLRSLTPVLQRIIKEHSIMHIVRQAENLLNLHNSYNMHVKSRRRMKVDYGIKQSPTPITFISHPDSDVHTKISVNCVN